jgi:hypothetical protein
VPDLLQTEEYAEAACRAVRPELGHRQIRRLVEVVLRRQQLLAPGRLQLHQVIDEAVLLRTIGSDPVMARQIEHLRSMAGQPFVKLQIAGLPAVHARISASFTVLRFGEDEDSPVWHESGGGRVGLITHQIEAGTARNTFAVLARTAMSPEESADFLAGLARGRRQGG